MIEKTLPFSKEQLESIAEKYGTPVWVTSEAVLKQRMQQMDKAFPVQKKIFYAIKANSNPHVVQVLKNNAVGGIDAVSKNEVRLALELGFSPEDIIFTGSNPSSDELRYIHEKGVLINAGSLSEVQRFGEMFPGENIAIRINPGQGKGMFEGLITGGEKSKFGIEHGQFTEAKRVLEKYNLSLVGIHAHVGSGFYTPEEFMSSVQVVLSEAESFPNLQFVDFGGGFGIPYRPEESHIDLNTFGEKVQEELKKFALKNGKEIEMRIEPGRFLVCESTVLLGRATTRKNQSTRNFIGIDTGMHHLIRPAMYGAYHHISNVSRPGEEKEVIDVVGNVCESSDIFRREVEIEQVREGDLLAIHDAGAYGSVMSSNYNLHGFAPEVLVRENGQIVLTRTRQTYEQVMDGFTPLS